MAEKALQGAVVEVALVQAAKADAEKNKHLLESICRTLQVREAPPSIIFYWDDFPSDFCYTLHY